MQKEGWGSPLIISLLVIGVALIVIFVIWEKSFAPITCIPYPILRDPTVVGACILSAVLFFSYYCWASYFASFLMVVNNLSVQDATYVSNVYGVGGTFFSLVVGWFLHRTGRFKAVTLWFAIPLHCLGLGLMIHFRQPDQNIGYIVMCQLFVACAGGIIEITGGIAVMAAVSHQRIAVVLAVEGLFSQIGGAIGSTVAASIWQSVFPKKLAQYLPAADLPDLELIYEDIIAQLSYPVGSDTRLAIQRAYGDAQTMMLAAGTAVWILAFGGVLLWKDIDLKQHKQVRGHVI
ncbi:MFS general substrate transporter [Clavulina sp. PMI_390]|nr:MFS general substrate transporter [Clavulina sp. PMI_390]